MTCWGRADAHARGELHGRRLAAGASGKPQGSVGSEDAGLSCLGTRSSSHSLSLVRRGGGTTRSSTGWQWKNASCCQPCTHGLGRSRCPAAAWLVSHCPPPLPSWGMDHCWEGRGMDAPPCAWCRRGHPRLQPWGVHADPRPGLQDAEAMGAATKGLSPPQQDVESRMACPGQGDSLSEGSPAPATAGTSQRTPHHQAPRLTAGSTHSRPSLCTPSLRRALQGDRGGMFSPGLFS